jgi:DNA-binding transcriptional MerR regulator
VIEPQEQLLRIHEVGRRLGLTPRAIRYYEEIGLLTPAGRTEGDHRLFSQADVERLQTIKSLRDDAGFSLADIGALLADEDERAARRVAYHGTTDVQQRRGLLVEELDRVDRHVVLLRGKIDRLAGMIGEAEARRARCLERIAIIDASGKDERA